MLTFKNIIKLFHFSKQLRKEGKMVRRATPAFPKVADGARKTIQVEDV